MRNSLLSKLKDTCGISLLELLAALFITGILAAASFKFYATIHEQSEVQYEVSEIQLMCRNSLQELKKNIRMAGYKIDDTLPAFEIAGDTLSIYLQQTQPIDTIRYFLSEYEPWEYARIREWSGERQLFKLMKQANSDTATTFADCITQLNFTAIDSANMSFSITAQTEHGDFNFSGDGDSKFKSYSLTERVKIRNAN